MKGPSLRLSPPPRIIRWLVLLFAALISFEAGSAYLFYLETGTLFYVSDLRKQTLQAAGAGPGVTTKLHPYYGFINVYDELATKQAGIIANRYGYTQIAAYWQIPGCCEFPFPPEEREKLFVIGIFGNSIAHGVVDYLQLFPSTTDLAKRIPGPAGKRIVILNLALGGHHQPQHLLALTHLLSIGMRFDMVVLLGTTQEVGSGVANVELGLSLDFPASSVWTAMTQALERQASDRPGDLLGLSINAAAKDTESLIDRCGIATCMVLLRPVLSIERTLAERLAPPQRTRITDAPHFFTARPQLSTAGREGVYQQAIALWRRSVGLMAETARASGAAFWMILLPNPWDHDSKLEPKVADEKTRAMVRDDARRSIALMRELNKDLKKSGVPVVDATRILDDLPFDSSLYLDQHGHYGQAGLKRVSEFIMEQISRPAQ
jgi:hypothetical protein